MTRTIRPLIARSMIPVLLLSTTASTQTPDPAARRLYGFTTARSEAQRALEARFDASLSADNLRDWMKRLSARPHHVGSPYGRENAEFIAGLFRSWGYETGVEEFHVLLPTPVTRRLELVAPTTFTARLVEPPIEGDATSGLNAGQLPTFNAYSIDGDVAAELVYVNYGLPADYEELERRGVDVKGRIVIARYGGSWRGIKPKVAAEQGAIGCIIYSDPREDGFFQGDAYPAEGWRPATGAQRGSVADMPLYPGDPLTPGVGATRDAPRPADVKRAATLTKIPVLPISQADALPLLQALGGPIAPTAWRGALPTPYKLGPGPAKVRLTVKFDWKLVPAYDVVATLRGSERPDQWIVRGNHHDAWVFGATDPVSGLVALLEEARGVSELARSGWRPRRTIVYAAWDGEEPGLLGSTEWVETHADSLRTRMVAYINTDAYERGLLEAGGSHTLEGFVNEIAREVADPKKGIPVADRLIALNVVEGTPEETALAREQRSFALHPLGSGSDYTPFLQHLGIASLNLGFGGEGQYGQYHSIYDSYDHFVRFMDPDFAYGVTLAKVTGRAVLRLAEADVLPFEFTRFSHAVARYTEEVEKLAETLRAESAERARRLDDRVYEALATPGETWVPPARLDPVPFMSFAPLRNAVERVRLASEAYSRALEQRWTADGQLPEGMSSALDAILMKAELSLTRAEGLPGRPWFRHQVYAPGLYTGYGVKTLPGVREALELRRWKDAEQQAAVAAAALDRFAGEVERAVALLQQR
jgi:N-acetylated-alpha-linked acidic dipeptidase